MLFPRTKFADENSLAEQIEHLESEIAEVREAYQQALVTGDWNHVADELVDCQISADTALHIVQEQHGADSFGAYTRVAAGCMRRGYYERKG